MATDVKLLSLAASHGDDHRRDNSGRKTERGNMNIPAQVKGRGIVDISVFICL